MVKNPAGNDYVRKNNVKINGKIYPETAHVSDLKSDIQQKNFEVIKRKWLLFKYKINPSALDSTVLNANLNRMLNRLTYQGYLAVRGSYAIRGMHKEHEKEVTYQIDLGQIYLLSDVVPYFEDPRKDEVFRELISRQRDFKIGDPFHFETLDKTLQSLQHRLNNHGYARLRKENIFISIDTTFSYIKKVRPTRFAKSHRTFSLFYTLDTTQLPSIYHEYKVNRILIRNLSTDGDSNKTSNFDHIAEGVLYGKENQAFKPSYILRQVNHVKIGQLYKLNEVSRVYNDFLNGRSLAFIGRYDDYPTDSTIDLYYEFSFRNKMAFNSHADFAFNDGARFLSNTRTQLLDLSWATELNINNVLKSSIQYAFYLRAGLQLGIPNGLSVLSQSFTVSNSLRFPGFWVFGKYVNARVQDHSTTLSVDMDYLNRDFFFTLYNVRFSLGYQWKYKNFNFKLTPFNLEFYYFNRQAYFEEYLSNSFVDIQNAYRDGKLISVLFWMGRSWSITPTVTLSATVSFEETGLYGSIYNSLNLGDRTPLFLRNEISSTLSKSFGQKSALVFHLYYGNNIFYQPNQETPYFRKFFAGGAYSMRAWQFRSLGPGSYVNVDTINSGVEKIGDVKLEANVEYRFNLFRMFGMQTEGALFADIGNIWTKRTSTSVGGENAIFSLPRLTDDIAVATGVGFRVKISFLVLRLDWAYRLKDPQLHNYLNFNQSIKDGVLQIGIGYPF